MIFPIEIREHCVGRIIFDDPPTLLPGDVLTVTPVISIPAEDGPIRLTGATYAVTAGRPEPDHTVTCG
ncbi:MAG: hypothetical protein KGL39_10805 [Patescibacteria group bacterium]|nr:hypothetical protein [Patescibacteria group bacterium]